MKELYHPNVITLRHAFYTQGDKVSDSPFLTLISKMKFTWMLWWTTYLKQSTVCWSTITKWSNPCQCCWSNCTHTSPSAHWPTSMHLESATETSSPRICWLTQPTTFWKSVISDLPNASKKARWMFRTFVQDITDHQNSFSELPITTQQSMFGQ